MLYPEFVDEALSLGESVVVHCAAGYGRTGTMLACYLVHKGYGPTEAINEVRRKRPGSIETKEQENAIYEYSARHGLGGDQDTGER